MARQEATNSFTEGLITDLHPLNTPNTVLTDCLNGTLITYNGNEFILQNDMGNYELKNCKLPVNFIPVGIKGYADILYIVSYNPLTEEVEVGSYPAPQSIFSTGDNQKSADDTELVPFYFGGKYEVAYKHSEIIEEQKHAVFIFMDGTDEESTKLYPGDEFFIDGLDENNLDGLFIYQHLNFYVIDENNKLYDIDDNDLYLPTPTESDYRKVFWETPGWLAAQYDLFVPDKFNLNLRSLNLPEFVLDATTQKEDKSLTASIDLSTQLIISDQLFINKLNGRKNTDTFKDLYIRFLINKPQNILNSFVSNGNNNAVLIENPDNPTIEESAENTLIYDIPCQWHNYQDDILTAYVNWSPTWNFVLPQPNDDGKYNLAGYEVKVVAYPIIKYTKDDNTTYTLKYTQFKTELFYELNNLKNIDEINIGNSIYKWSVDDDSCTISFNIDGPFINATNIKGTYNIYRLNYFYKKAKFLDNKRYSESSWTYLRDDSKTYNEDTGENDSCLLAINSPNNNRLLMMTGELSNLALFGQNTINVYYEDSKSYTLTDYLMCTNYNKIQGSGDYICSSVDKHLKFEKEGGIYMFEVILSQGEGENPDELAKKQFLLIPSILFNDWFGELDNYLTSITSSQWLGKYLDNLNINSVINSISVDFANENHSDAFKVYYGTHNNTIDPEEKASTDNDILLKQINLIKGLSEQDYEWNQMPEQFRYEIDVSKLVKSITANNTTLDLDKLQGNLWNPVVNGNFSLYTTSGDELLHKDINTGEWKFYKNLVYNWNVETSNSRSKHIPNTPEVYPFSYSKRYGLKDPKADSTHRTLRVIVQGGSSSAGSRKTGAYEEIYAQINADISQWSYMWFKENQSGRVRDTSSVNFTWIGQVLNNYNLRWAIVDFYRNNADQWDNYRGYLVRDSDDNSDRAFTYKMPVGNGGLVGGKYIIMFAGSGTNNTQDNSTVAISFNTTGTDREDFLAALFHIKAYNYSSENTTVYYPKFNISNLIETESVNLNKMELICNLNLLRVDDENWLDPSDNLLNLNSKLIEKPQILLSKNQVVSFSNTLVNLKYTDNDYYSDFINTAPTWFSTYNGNVQSKLTNYNDRTGTGLMYTTEDDTWTDDMVDALGKLLGNENFEFRFSKINDANKINQIKQIAENLINNYLSVRNISKPYTNIDNIVFKNKTDQTLKYVNAHRDADKTSPVEDCAAYYVCYYQDWSNE